MENFFPTHRKDSVLEKFYRYKGKNKVYRYENAANNLCASVPVEPITNAADGLEKKNDSSRFNNCINNLIEMITNFKD